MLFKNKTKLIHLEYPLVNLGRIRFEMNTFEIDSIFYKLGVLEKLGIEHTLFTGY